jgi:predicted helicase
MIPTTNPFLKNLFEECTRIGETQRDCLDLEELGVTELVKMLKEVNIEAILQDFGRQKKGEDPVIHFYEDFLREYDPKQKVKRGVFYTPDPVVSFIVRSADYLLRKEFDCPDGLADTSTIPVTYKNTKINGEVIEEVKQVPKVQILDIATGTGTFLKYVIEEIRKTFEENHKNLSDEELRKEWNKYVDKNLLSRVFGFELLMAPYAIAHLKLGLKLRETGYDFSSHNRLGVALTNALESGRESAEKLDAYLGWLAQESKYANYVKTAKNIYVVIGNPPYLGISENMGDWITGLIEDYKYVDGKHFGEKKHWLQDDYVKFIRFGQWKIDRTGEGILGFITNHGYLDNPTFRGMRQSLMKSFDEIYLLNLHGNSLKKEKCPDGSKDENVFDIRQGVAIGLFIKRKGGKEKRERIARVYYTELWGLRDDKYKWLLRNAITTTEWEELKPNSPFYFFVPMEETGREDYEKYWKVTDIFPVNCTGIVTARDKFVIDFDSEALRRRIEMFRDLSLSDDFVRQSFNLKENYMWRIKKARNDLSKVQDWEDNFTKILYRPFDIREIYFHDSVVWRTRKEVMRHMMQENISLCAMRQVSLDEKYTHFLASQYMVDNRTFLSSKGIVQQLPLYIYSDEPKETLGEKASKPERAPNFTDEFLQAIKETLGKEPTPEEIFYYIYAVLYSPTYRTRYEEFLEYDFPRVPLTSDKDLFKTLCRLGSELVSLHLMESPELDNLITDFKGEGDNVVDAIGKNSYKNGKLKINKTQYFEGIPEEVYNFHIGGYQVCQKWLKDRKGRKLTEEEIEHYQKIVVGLNETIRIMEEIDKVIEGHGGWPVR